MAEADINDEHESYRKSDELKGLKDNRYSFDKDDEFDCDEDELSKSFNEACERLKTIAHSLSPAELLEFYGLYKQATVGPCTVPRPGWYAFEAKQKWDAWNKIGDMSKTDAMNNYVRLSKRILTMDDDNRTAEDPVRMKSGWVTVSSMADSDGHLNEEDKTIFDRVKENDLVKIRELIRGRDVNGKDPDGMGLIHWAADRGGLDMIKFLVDEMNADIEIRDADGQTAMHYAASCGHKDVLQFLIDKGADKNVADNDGVVPKDIASDKDIESMLL